MSHLLVTIFSLPKNIQTEVVLTGAGEMHGDLRDHAEKAAAAAMVVELQTTGAALAETTDTAIATAATRSTRRRGVLVVHRT